jgi:uncharacterized protein
MTRPAAESMLEKLVCPVSRGPLRYDPALQELVSESAGLVYPVRNGMPILLLEKARPLQKN